MLGIGVAMALTPAAASAATTFGANLSGPASGAYLGCVNPCSAAQKTTSPAYVSPITGVLVQWAVAGSSGPLAAEVVHGSTGGAESAVQTPATDGVVSFPTRLPIAGGDRIALVTPGGGHLGIRDSGGLSIDVWAPPLATGETRSPTNSAPSAELLLSGTVEPDADHDGYGDETQDRCPADAATQAPCSGKRAAALKRCKAQAKKRDWTKKRLKKCRRKALRLPV